MSENTSMILRIIFMSMVTLTALFDDIRRYKISNKICLAGLLAAILVNLAEAILGHSVWNYVIGALAAFLLMFMAYIIMAVGAGDVKLVGVLGLLVGLRFVGTIVLWAFLYTGIFGVLLMFCKKCRVKGSMIGTLHTVHFSAALVIGEFITVIMMIAGGEITI